MLIFESVVKHFERRHALGPLSLRVQQGHTVAITGPPGAGKTTLLRLALGLISPEAGIVIVGGIAITPAHVMSARRRIGYVPQGGVLFPHLSVGDNAALPARAQGWLQRQRGERLQSICAQLHLPPSLLAEFPDRLSDGQRLRACLLRAMVLDPEVLLIDEPFRGLDPMTRLELRSETARVLRDLGKAVLFVSDQLVDCAAVSEDIVLLRAGTIAQRGTMRELAERPANLFVGEFVRAQRHIADRP